MYEAREGSSRGLAARERAEGSKFKGPDWCKHLDNGGYLVDGSFHDECLFNLFHDD